LAALTVAIIIAKGKLNQPRSIFAAPTVIAVKNSSAEKTIIQVLTGSTW
jgi:hypothetical protein